MDRWAEFHDFMGFPFNNILWHPILNPAQENVLHHSNRFPQFICQKWLSSESQLLSHMMHRARHPRKRLGCVSKHNSYPQLSLGVLHTESIYLGFHIPCIASDYLFGKLSWITTRDLYGFWNIGVSFSKLGMHWVLYLLSNCKANIVFVDTEYAIPPRFCLSKEIKSAWLFFAALARKERHQPHKISSTDPFNKCRQFDRKVGCKRRAHSWLWKQVSLIFPVLVCSLVNNTLKTNK